MAIKIVDEGQQLLFTEEVHPVQGPLPALNYKLLGLWQHKGVILRAYFQANEIPTEHNEVAFYRWEPALTAVRAKYQYFNVPNAAGLFLKPALVTRMVRSGGDVPEVLEDICGNFSPLSLRDLLKSHI